LRDLGSHSELRFPLERLQRSEPARTWNVEVPIALLEDLGAPLQVGDVALVPEEAAVVELVFDQVHGGVTVNGKISVVWHAECSRCLSEVDGLAVAEIEELFEENPQEGESYQLGEEFIDLEPMVRDAVLLELPVGVIRCSAIEECLESAPSYLSSEDDLGGSQESNEMKDPRWAVLDELKFEGE